MLIRSAKANANTAGVRVAGAVAGTLILLLVLLALVRPEMMGMATVHKLMAATGL